jgi:peptide deformylase
MNLFGFSKDSQLPKLKIEIYGSEVLRAVSAPVEKITPELRVYAERMIEAMIDNNGCGLAAPQVGRNIRLITLMTEDDEAEVTEETSAGERLLGPLMPLALVNPEIVSVSEEQCGFVEGCLSIPEVNGEVIRPVSIVLKAQLIDGRSIEVECGGLLGRALQHEVDHLNGKLFVDRVDEADLKQAASQLRHLEKQVQKRQQRLQKRS